MKYFNLKNQVFDLLQWNPTLPIPGRFNVSAS